MRQLGVYPAAGPVWLVEQQDSFTPVASQRASLWWPMNLDSGVCGWVCPLGLRGRESGAYNKRMVKFLDDCRHLINGPWLLGSALSKYSLKPGRNDTPTPAEGRCVCLWMKRKKWSLWVRQRGKPTATENELLEILDGWVQDLSLWGSAALYLCASTCALP